MDTSKFSYRYDIDGLRAIAVVAVIFYHAGFGIFAGGFTGVDIFFVISGFLITQHLVTEIQTNKTIRFASFYAKRFRRLFPALVVVIVFTLISWFLFLRGDVSESRQFVRSVRFSLFGLANIFFKNNSGGYFDSATDEMPLLHFWSLAVEEQFYLVWPMIILISHKLKPEGFFRNLKAILTCLIIISFAFSVYFIEANQSSTSFYLMPLRAWELGMGGLAVLILPVTDRLLTKKKSQILFGIGLLLISASIFYITPTFKFPGLWALPAVMGTLLLILAGNTYQNVVLRSRIFVFVGSISYGWYLWHWPLFAMKRLWNMGEPLDMVSSWSIILISGFLAYLSLRFIEIPVRFGERFKSVSSSKIILSSLISALLVTLGAQAFRSYEKSSLSSSVSELNKLVEERSPFFKNCVDQPQNIGSKKCLVIGNVPSRNIIFVWGDSHAHSFFPLIEEYVKDRNAAAILYSSTGTPSLIPIPSLKFSVAQQKTNHSVLEDMKKQIKASPGFEYSVILASRWKRDGGMETITKRDPIRYLDHQNTYEGTMKVLENSLRETILRLSVIGIKKILLFTAYPEFKYNVTRCFLREPEACQENYESMQKYFQDTEALFHRLKSDYKNIELVNFLPYVCRNKVCPQIMDGKIPVVRDDDHPSAVAARQLLPHVRPKLDWLIGQ